MKPRPVSKRDRQIGAAKVAGFHGDQRSYVRALVERRGVSREALGLAYTQGMLIRQNGGRCGCFECSRELAKAAKSDKDAAG